MSSKIPKIESDSFATMPPTDVNMANQILKNDEKLRQIIGYHIERTNQAENLIQLRDHINGCYAKTNLEETDILLIATALNKHKIAQQGEEAKQNAANTINQAREMALSGQKISDETVKQIAEFNTLFDNVQPIFHKHAKDIKVATESTFECVSEFLPK